MFLNLFKSKNEIAHDKLRSYVDFVKSILVDSQCSVPFYIMGGSVYSTLKGLELFTDIDVFFSNTEDAEAAIAAVEAKMAYISKANTTDLYNLSMLTYSSPNALSFNWDPSLPSRPDVKIQFIRKRVGTINELFDSFDLNTSQCCITSNYDIMTNVTLDEDIKIIFKEFNANTIQRYYKYVTEKKCTDEGATQVFESIDYLIDNFFIKIEESMYDDAPEMLGYMLLTGLIGSSLDTNNRWDEFFKYLYDGMCKKFKKEELVQAFIALNFDFTDTIKRSCTEHDVFNLVSNKSKMITQDNINQAHEQYPEYFI